MNNPRILTSLMIFSLCCILWTCNEDEVDPREYPRLRTRSVATISSSGAEFRADILNPGPSDIVEYGFVWGEDPFLSIESADKLIIADLLSSDQFSATINSLLEESVTYYVRSYARNEKFLVYGNSVKFLSLGSNMPEVHQIVPDTGVLGDTILLKGRGFSYRNSRNEIRFDSVRSWSVLEATDSTLITTVPDSLNADISEVSVGYAGNNGTGVPFTLLSPVIDSLNRDRGNAGDTILIHGKRFGNYPHHVKVLFGASEAPIISYDPGRLVVKVPVMQENTDKLIVQVGHQQVETPFSFFYPTIVDFEPKSASWGDIITFTVEDFVTDDFSLMVNNVTYEVLSKTESEIQWRIPAELNGTDFGLSFKVGSETLRFKDRLNLLPPVIIPENDTLQLGTDVRVLVKNLHPTNNKVVIRYNYGNQQLSYTRISDEEISFKLPLNPNQLRDRSPDDNKFFIEISTGNNLFTRRKGVFFLTPVIENIFPSVTSSLDEEIIIQGKNFGNYPYVRIDDEYLTIQRSEDREVAVTIPVSILRHPDVGEKIVTGLRVTNPVIRRSGWSETQVEINHIRALAWVNEGGVLYKDADPLPWTRASYLGWGHDGYAYLIGGRTYGYGSYVNNSFYQFDPSNSSWKLLPRIPLSEANSYYEDFLNLNGNLYLLMNIETKMTLFRYQYASGSWAQLAISDELFAKGAKHIFESDGRIFASSLESGKVYEYIPSEARWSDTGAGLPGRILYTFTNNGQEIFRMEDGDYIFDSAGLSWIVSNNQANTYVSLIDHKGKKYRLADGHNVYEYDPVTKSETLLITLPASGTPVFPLNGKLYFFMRDYPEDMVSFDLNF